MNINMINKNQKHALLRNLLSNSLPVLCKNGLGIPDVQFSLEAFVGITVGEGEEVILVSIKETVTSEGINISHSWTDPLEDCTKGIKKEAVDENFAESEICDLTEETEESMEDQKTFQRNEAVEEGFSSTAWMTAEVETFVKKEQQLQLYTSGSSEPPGDDEEAVGGEGEGMEDFSFPANFSPYRTEEGSCHGQREAFALQSRRMGRARLFQKGRFRSFRGAPGRAWHSPAAKNKIRPAFHEQNTCDDLVLRSSSSCGGGGGAYQDLMKEMCEQVVNQSMSMETQYVCHICQARRCSKSSLMDHIRGTHLAMDKYTCGECGERFRWFMQLHRHRKKFHPEPGDDINAGGEEMAATAENLWNS